MPARKGSGDAAKYLKTVTVYKPFENGLHCLLWKNPAGEKRLWM